MLDSLHRRAVRRLCWKSCGENTKACFHKCPNWKGPPRAMPPSFREQMASPLDSTKVRTRRLLELSCERLRAETTEDMSPERSQVTVGLPICLLGMGLALGKSIHHGLRAGRVGSKSEPAQHCQPWAPLPFSVFPCILPILRNKLTKPRTNPMPRSGWAVVVPADCRVQWRKRPDTVARCPITPTALGPFLSVTMTVQHYQHKMMLDSVKVCAEWNTPAQPPSPHQPSL